MVKSYKFRAYPTAKQQVLIKKQFDANRFVYNFVLDAKIKAFRRRNENVSKSLLTKIKHTSKYAWLNEVDSGSLQQSLRDLDMAYKNFFNRGNKGFPKFKSKRNNRKSCRFVGRNLKVKVDNQGKKFLFLPKLHWIGIKNQFLPGGKITSVTLTQVPSGKYYVSICCQDVEIEKLQPISTEVGIDLGLKDLVITSNGEKYSTVRFDKKLDKKIKQAQRKLSKKVRGSHNYEKQRIKLARLKEQEANQRQDYLHKISTKLINENQVICCEDLAVNNLIKNHKLARAEANASWSTLIFMLKYKAEWYGRQLIQIDRFFPSSKTCSCCGERSTQVNSLSVRDWTCEHCGAHHDRDINAAINILNEGIKFLATA